MDACAEKILIVDGDPASRRELTEVALEQGLTVLASADYEGGAQCHAAEDPRLIILDWERENGAALELCRAIRDSPTGEYAVILMLSYRDRPEDLEDALEAGVDFFMKKPVRPAFYRAWIAAARRNAAQLRLHERRSAKLVNYKEELEAVNEQLEASIARANEMAMEAERAYIEINQIFKTVSGGIVLIDDSFNIIRHNDAFLEMADIGGEVLHKKCHDVFPSDLCGTPDCPMERIRKGEAAVETKICKEDAAGRSCYRVQSRPFRGLAGEFLGIVEHIIDITAMVEAEEALRESERLYREMSIIDELTGLYNKRHFNNHLKMEMQRAQRHHHPLSLIMMDIDFFKRHNDTYGHAEGDKVLARLGEILNASIRATDLACRYGGEEFVVILPDTPSDGAEVVAERIRTAFAAVIFRPGDGKNVSKTISLGVTQFHQDEDMESFIKRADANLYRAKESGRNKVVGD